MKTERTFSNTLCMRSLKAPSEFCSGGIRECSQVEMLAGHLKHTICSNLSTWKHCTQLQLYSYIYRLKNVIQPSFHSGLWGGLPGNRGLEALLLPSGCLQSYLPLSHNLQCKFNLYILFTIVHFLVVALKLCWLPFSYITKGLLGACHEWISAFDSLTSSQNQITRCMIPRLLLLWDNI